MKIKYWLSLLFICLLLPLSALADETVITEYKSNIAIASDAHLVVTETIQIHSNGIDITHGIYRDFPTTYKIPNGGFHKVGFHLISTTFNDNNIPNKVVNIPYGVRIYVGDPKEVLPAGDYTYVIQYETNRQLRFFPDHDELYWNVTGNRWWFPIEKATVIVSLPNGAVKTISNLTAYTGAMGSRDHNFESKQLDSGDILFTTTQPLAAQEGLTIAVAWGKGFVTPPTTADNIRYFLQDNLGLIIAGIGFIVVFLFYLLEWLRVRLKTGKDTIIPEYTPVAGFSPAELRYIKDMRYDSKVFTSAVINMAVKGYLTIQQQKHKYTLIKQDKGDYSILSEEEQIICRGQRI